MTDSPLPTGKGRPTPKRSDSQKRRGGPVPPPPANRREAAKRLRSQAADQRRQVKAGTKTGDPKNLLKRDQGPMRALVRDVVDSRRHVGVLLLPAAVLPLLGQLTRNPRVVGFATTLWVAALAAAVVDFTVTSLAVRRRLRSDFPGDTSRGHLLYGGVRTAQFRRFRLPPPRVNVGDPV